MKKRYIKLLFALGIIIVGAIFYLWKSVTLKKVLTESEAAETLIYYLQSLDDYYPDIAIYDDNVIIREWPSEDGAKILQITSKDLANDDQYFIFGYYSRANEEWGNKYFTFINYYAVHRETGEIIEQQAWNDSNVGQNDYNEVHFMSEEEATQVFFIMFARSSLLNLLGPAILIMLGIWRTSGGMKTMIFIIFGVMVWQKTNLITFLNTGVICTALELKME